MASLHPKQLVKAFLAQPPVWRATAALRHPGVVVLMYHRINDGEGDFPGMPAAQFREQMRWLKDTCTPIWPEDLLEASRHADRARPPVLVTFDDGYRDYHDRAYPVLSELGIPAVVFVSTRFMDEGGLIWTEALHWAGVSSAKPTVRLPWPPHAEFTLSTPAARAAFVTEAKAHLKNIADAERRRLLDELLAALAAPPVEERLGRQMLSWDEVRAVREGTRIGGHSHTHPILSQLPAADMEREIVTCRDRIDRETGERPRFFAYPNGRPADFNAVTRELLERHGFDVAFSTIEGINGPESDRLALRRQPAGGTTLGDFAFIVARA